MKVDETGDGIAFEVKVKPGAGRPGVEGVRGEALAVSVKSQPEAGKANKEVIKLIAKMAGVDSERVRITSGKKSRRKRVRISGIGRTELEQKIKTVLTD